MTGLLASLVTSAAVSATSPSAVFVAETFAAVERLDAAIPALTASAEQAAERIWRNPHASIEVPRKPQWGFAEELWERAGGLAQMADGAFDTPDNVVLLSSGVKAPAEARGRLPCGCGGPCGSRRRASGRNCGPRAPDHHRMHAGAQEPNEGHLRFRQSPAGVFGSAASGRSACLDCL